MKFKGLFLLFFTFFYFHHSFAQVQGELTQSRILILLDESSSMIQKWPSGKEKYKAADELILHLMDSIYAINPDVEFSLRVFGHQYTVEQNNCYDTKNEVPFSKDNRVQMALRLDDIRPLGVTPISYALLQAAKFDLVDEEHNAYSIILFTDGGESCGGDICEVMKKLMKYKVYFKPYIVSLEDDATLKTTYSCMGDFLQVTKDADMPRAVSTIVNAFRPAIKITKTDYKQIQTLAANVPSALKVNIPLTDLDQHSDSKVIKKESEEIPKPVKKTIDTVAKPVVKTDKPTPPKTDTIVAPKPVSKIKIDEAPVKPPTEKIAPVATATCILLYTSAPFAKAPKSTLVPSVEIIVLPPAENISAAIPAQPIQSNTPAPSKIVLKNVPVPQVEIITKPEPEHIAAITPLNLKMANYFLPPAKQMNLIAQPPAPVIEVPVTLIPEKITAISLSSLVTVQVTNVRAPKPVTINVPPAPQIQVQLTAENINRVSVMQQRPVATVDLATTKPQVRPLAALPALVVDNPVAPNNPDQITRLKIREIRPRQNIFVIEDKGIFPRKLPPLPPLKIDIPKVTVSQTSALPVNDAAPFKPALFTVVTEDAKETSLEIYITNGHGKFFNSTPQMLLLEPGTNKVIKTFYRTVDANGNPDPQTNLPVGTYNIALSAKKTLGVNNVKIEQNKKKKITITVLPASLSFAYADAPKRPINEFVARVTERNKAQGRVQDQKCTAALEYDAGNYHIMINTFPQIDRNVDLDFEETVITIPQPGFVKFNHDDNLRSVTLYNQQGDKFAFLQTINLNDPAAQPLRIQPGEYQAHYHKGPGQASVSEKVVIFFVKATQTTEVELN